MKAERQIFERGAWHQYFWIYREVPPVLEHNLIYSADKAYRLQHSAHNGSWTVDLFKDRTAPLVHSAQKIPSNWCVVTKEPQ